jgi:phenylacetate-CoA ligase
VLQTEEEQDFSQTLHLRVELSEGTAQANQVEEWVRQVFVTELPKLSSEYRHLLQSVKDQAHPKVTAYDYSDPAYFARGTIKKTA